MDRDLDEINVVPLVDVMLVLLVIVLTTATFIVHGQIPVELAKAGAAEKSPEKPLVLTLAADGRAYLQDRPVALDTLGDALATQERRTPVVIRADRSVVLERFVTATDAVKRLGFADVSLEVERP